MSLETATTKVYCAECGYVMGYIEYNVVGQADIFCLDCVCNIDKEEEE
jgi:hypothetical protein